MNKFLKWTKHVVAGLLVLILVFGALTYAAGRVAKSNILRANPAPGQLVEVGGFKMHIHCTGEGSPTVLLAAGLDDFSIFWSLVQPEIAETTRVCSYDRAGLGWSEPSPNPRTSKAMVAELHELLVNASVHPPYVLVGHSFGGVLTRLYAHKYPDEVLGIVLVDAAPDDLFVRVPFWRNAIEGKLGLYSSLAPMSSFGLLAFTPESIPNRGMPDDVLAQYRAIAVSTDYFHTGVAENEAFEGNLAEVRNANIDLGEMPLVVISRGYWDTIPGFSEIKNQQAWHAWNQMQSDLLSLSSNSRQIIATESEHHIQLQQPELVIESILDVFNFVQQVPSKKDISFVPSQGEGPIDAAEMEAFMDNLFAHQMKENHIVGAAIAVIKDGKLFFAKGYGYADLANNIPVNPEQTIFHVGSVGKTFTWTAVMQLVEQGKLNLDTDVNAYLDFHIPDTYLQPITLKHLMTHTSGIEDRWLGSAASDESELVSAREWLVANFPGRVRPPGEAAGYSNYNAMLAGYIVAQVSRQPYEQYVQEHIFDPLGMTHSTVYSPMPSDLREDLSVSYTYADGVFHPFPEYLVQPAGLPSGMHHASATDMARFMSAHLQGGFYGDAATEVHILKETTRRQMLSTLYTPDPRLGGTAYGFFDMSDNGQWTLGHSGYLPSMHSLLLLLPDQNLGVYVAYNSAGGDALTIQHTGFQRAFFDHYYPAPAVEPIQPPADFAERAERFVGLYRSANSHSTTPEKVIGLLGGFTIEITAPGDGTLLIPMEGLELRFVELEPLYFRQMDGPFALLFREDGRGNVTHVFTDIQPQNGFVRLNWYEAPGFNMTLALVCVLLFVSMLPVALVRGIRNRRYESNRSPASRAADRLIYAISLLNVLFLVGLALWFRPERPSELHGLPLTVEIVLGLGVLAAVLTVGALVYAALAWKNSYWSVVYRVYYTLVTLAAVAFVWFLHYWNWLGWRY